MRVCYVSLVVASALSLSMTLAAGAVAKEPYRQVLISASLNMNVDPNLVSKAAIASRYAAPECPIPWTVRKFRQFGGKQEQVDVIWIDNGKLRIGVCPTRGMSILAVFMGENRVLGWDSPVKDLVHPGLINLNSRGGFGWLDGFNEWLCRGGLEWNGQPGTDHFLNAQGQEVTAELTLHGRIANLPAQEVLLVAERDPPYRLTLRGIVHERMFNGPKLELTTELSIDPGARSFRLSDAVTNRGGMRQEFEVLYHTNFGPPLLEEGAKLLIPVEVVTPLDQHAAKDVKRFDQYPGPRAGTVEQFYAIQPLTDRSGHTLVMIHNKAADLAASLRYDTHELPFLTLWKNMADVADGYVTGIEPGTNYPNNRRIERIHGRVPSLSPGESHFVTIDFNVYAGADEVRGVAREIQQIQGDRRPLLNEEPE
jgi:hypothetical protein